MPSYEYKVVPAPAKGVKAKGVKAPDARFALSVESVLNRLGSEGWEYLRAELLPSDERSGLTGTVTNWRNVLVFRRALDVPEATAPAPVPAPEAEDPEATVVPVVMPPMRERAAPEVGPAVAEVGAAPPVVLTPEPVEDVAEEVEAETDIADEVEVEEDAPKEATAPEPVPEDYDDSALSGIEKVVRRNAARNAELQDKTSD